MPVGLRVLMASGKGTGKLGAPGDQGIYQDVLRAQ